MLTTDGHRVSLSTEKGVTWFAMGGPHLILKARISLEELEALIAELTREASLWRKRILPDYYAALCVSRTATTAEIKAAYRRLMKQHHPDTGGETDTTQAINKAYAVLGDRERRREYDVTLLTQ